MASADEGDPKAPPGGWVRSNWLSEKIVSGELPAAANDTMKKCDSVFVENAGLEEHVKLMAALLTGDSGETPADTERRLDGLRAYLQRLLSVREMWARERC